MIARCLGAEPSMINHFMLAPWSSNLGPLVGTRPQQITLE